MQNELESVAKKILPDEKINTIAYGCTSGTIAIGEDNVKKKLLCTPCDAPAEDSANDRGEFGHVISFGPIRIYISSIAKMYHRLIG